MSNSVKSSSLLYSLFTFVFVLGMFGQANASEYIPVENVKNLTLSFTDKAWDGITVPVGQQCKMFEGNGASPEIKVSNIPLGVNAIIVSFNDKTYKKNDNGGHGIVGIWVNKGEDSMTIPALIGESNALPDNMFVEAKFRSARGKSGIYLPPCSGGRGNTYDATVKAVYKSLIEHEKSSLLGKGTITLGAY